MMEDPQVTIICCGDHAIELAAVDATVHDGIGSAVATATVDAVGEAFVGMDCDAR